MWNDWYPSQGRSEVQDTNTPTWSGLYDARGVKLFRPANPVGFAPILASDKGTLRKSARPDWPAKTGP